MTNLSPAPICIGDPLDGQITAAYTSFDIRIALHNATITEMPPGALFAATYASIRDGIANLWQVEALYRALRRRYQAAILDEDYEAAGRLWDVMESTRHDNNRRGYVERYGVRSFAVSYGTPISE